MDEYLSEKEQIERIRNWWHENGWYLIGGVILGLGAIFGYGRYQGYSDARAEEAQLLYEQAAAAVADDNLADLDAVLEQLREEYASSPYTDHAGLLAARLVLVRDSARAADELSYVMETTDDDELAMIARLRLARVLAYREEYAEALALLELEDLGQFASRVSDIRGDIYLEQGDIDAARSAFAAALGAPGADLLDREFVQMKLTDLVTLAGGQSEPAEPLAPEAGPAPDASAEPPAGGETVAETPEAEAAAPEVEAAPATSAAPETGTAPAPSAEAQRDDEAAPDASQEPAEP